MKSLLLLACVSRLLVAASGIDDLEEAERLQQAGQNAKAERAYQQVLETARDWNAAQLNALGIQLEHRARPREAEWAYRRSLEAWDRLRPGLAASRSITAGNLGRLLQWQGRYPDAEPFLVEAVKHAEAASGAPGLNTARATNSLASLYYAWGRLDKAEFWAVRADTILGGLANTCGEHTANRRLLASVLLAERKYAEGEALLKGLLIGLPERQVVGAYNDLAVAESSQGNLAEAEPIAVRALELARRVFTPEHPMVATSLNNLAQIQRFEGRYLDAERNYREAITIWEHALGPQHPDTAKGVMNLAAFYHERGRETGAEDLYRRAAEVFDASLGSEHALTLVARNELGEVLRSQHRYAESEKLSRATLGRLEELLGDHDPRVIRALTNYAQLLRDTRHASEAAALRQRIEGLRQSFAGQNP